MWKHLLAIAVFALLCGGWVLLQRWVARRAPGVKGPESGGGCASCTCDKTGQCQNEKSGR